MFSKSKTSKAKPTQPRAPQTPSLISHGLTIMGDLKSQGEIQVDGVITGDVDCSRLVIGERATIKGEVIAEHVVIRGEVHGRVLGGQVSLAKTARVLGDILHRSLSMEAGAHLEGQVKKVEDPRATEPAGIQHLLKTGKATRLETPLSGGGTREFGTDVAAGA